MSPVSLAAGQDQIQPIVQGYKEPLNTTIQFWLPKNPAEDNKRATINTTLEAPAIPCADSRSARSDLA